MVKVDLAGVAKATAKGRTYWYAWRGGPRLVGEPGSPEFIASYNEAHASRRTVDNGRFLSLVVAYRASGDFKNLAPTTKRVWSPWLDKIADHFGSLRIAQFDRTEKIRPVIRRWRNRWAATPRTADLGVQVLSRVCSYGVDPDGRLASNPCEGLKQLYGGGGRAEIIWTDADIKQLKATCSTEIAIAVDLAAATGLRLGDLVRLSWSHIGENEIIIATSKSRRRREAVIPLYDDLRELLARIPRRATTILTSSHRRPWTVNGIGSSFNKAKTAAGMAERDLHFHDLRGTAATRFYIADVPIRVIAEIMAWSEVEVEKIIRRYVGRDARTKELIAHINRTTRRT